MTDLERRYAPRNPIEFRASTKSGSAGVLVGYALKYDTLSRNLGGFVETIAPGTFDKSLADGVDVLARYNHDDNMLLGRTSSGTVRLTNDSVGIQYEVDLPDTTVGRDVATLAARGDVYQSSFAFYTHTDEWGQTDQGFPLRTLRAASLVDVAPVNSPAYLDTSVGLRSFASAHGLSFEDVERAARANRALSSVDPDPAEPDTKTCPACAALAADDNGGQCACAVGCDCTCEACTCTPGSMDSGCNCAGSGCDCGVGCNCACGCPDCTTPSRSSAPHGIEIPQVDNHGLVVVRKRLLELNLRRTP